MLEPGGTKGDLFAFLCLDVGYRRRRHWRLVRFGLGRDRRRCWLLRLLGRGELVGEVAIGGDCCRFDPFEDLPVAHLDLSIEIGTPAAAAVSSLDGLVDVAHVDAWLHIGDAAVFMRAMVDPVVNVLPL